LFCFLCFGVCSVWVVFVCFLWRQIWWWFLSGGKHLFRCGMVVPVVLLCGVGFGELVWWIWYGGFVVVQGVPVVVLFWPGLCVLVLVSASSRGGSVGVVW
jgi:hypothetical protein